MPGLRVPRGECRIHVVESCDGGSNFLEFPRERAAPTEDDGDTGREDCDRASKNAKRRIGRPSIWDR